MKKLKLFFFIFVVPIFIISQQQIGRPPFYSYVYEVDSTSPPESYHAQYDFGDGLPSGINTYNITRTDVVEDGYECIRLVTNDNGPVLTVEHSQLSNVETRYIQIRLKRTVTCSWLGERLISRETPLIWSSASRDVFSTSPTANQWVIITVDNSLLNWYDEYTDSRYGWRFDFSEYFHSTDTLFLDWISIYESP